MQHIVLRKALDVSHQSYLPLSIESSYPHHKLQSVSSVSNSSAELMVGCIKKKVRTKYRVL